jgi:hypothetical protein
MSGICATACFLDEGIVTARGFCMRRNGIAEDCDSRENETSRFDAENAHTRETSESSFLQDHIYKSAPKKHADKPGHEQSEKIRPAD